MYTMPSNVIDNTPDYLIGVDKGQPVLVQVSARNGGASNRDNLRLLSTSAAVPTGCPPAATDLATAITLVNYLRTQMLALGLVT